MRGTVGSGLSRRSSLSVRLDRVNDDCPGSCILGRGGTVYRMKAHRNLINFVIKAAYVNAGHLDCQIEAEASVTVLA